MDFYFKESLQPVRVLTFLLIIYKIYYFLYLLTIKLKVLDKIINRFHSFNIKSNSILLQNNLNLILLEFKKKYFKQLLHFHL